MLDENVQIVLLFKCQSNLSQWIMWYKAFVPDGTFYNKIRQNHLYINISFEFDREFSKILFYEIEEMSFFIFNYFLDELSSMLST